MKLNEELEQANNLAESMEVNETQNVTIVNLLEYWPILRVALKILIIFTNKRADAKINALIAIGDGLHAVQFPK